MSLIDFIQKIQKKPRYVRIQLLWASVFVCMLFVVSVWGFSFKHSLSIEDDNKKEDINISDDMVSLKDAFKASIGAFFEKEENNFEQIEAQIENEDEIINDLNESNEVKPARLPLSQ